MKSILTPQERSQRFWNSPNKTRFKSGSMSMISRRASSSSLVVAARDWGDARASLREAARATRLLEAIVTSEIFGNRSP
jgi:hypothetical protein